MRAPTQNEMRAFFQGYQTRQDEVVKAQRDARAQRKSAAQFIRDSYLNNLRLWQMRAETKGYGPERYGPKLDQVITCAVIALAFVAFVYVWVHS